MTLNAFDPQQPADNVVGEISFADIVDFFLRSWKKLFAAAVLGALFGLFSSFLIGTYSAEYIFFNRIQNVFEIPGNTASEVSVNEDDRAGSAIASSKPSIKNMLDGTIDNIAKVNLKSNPYSLDLTDWKSIQKALPSVAEQVLASGKGTPEQISLYRELAEDSWWRKNAIPTFLAVSKVDTKDVAGTIKDLDPDSFVLMSLTLTASGRSAQSALNNVQGAADFLRTAGSYIQVRNLLNSYEAESIGSPAEMQKRITNAKIEIAYQQERFNQLEQLRKRFPANSNNTQAILNPKDSGAKYLPISTQLIAIQSEINSLQERLQRHEQKLMQLAIIKSFLDQAKPLAAQTYDGLELSTNLLGIEAKLRLQLPVNERAGQEILDRVRAQLLQIQGRFTKGIEPAALIKTSGIATAMAAGAVITFLLVLLWLLAKQSWLNAKKLA
jgi:hypothetical protein